MDGKRDLTMKSLEILGISSGYIGEIIRYMGLSKYGLDTHFKKHSFQCAIPFETSRFDSLSIANQLNRSMVVCEQLPFPSIVRHCSKGNCPIRP
jgi:hypothetical protein